MQHPFIGGQLHGDTICEITPVLEVAAHASHAYICKHIYSTRSRPLPLKADWLHETSTNTANYSIFPLST